MLSMNVQEFNRFIHDVVREQNGAICSDLPIERTVARIASAPWWARVVRYPTGILRGESTSDARADRALDVWSLDDLCFIAAAAPGADVTMEYRERPRVSQALALPTATAFQSAPEPNTSRRPVLESLAPQLAPSSMAPSVPIHQPVASLECRSHFLSIPADSCKKRYVLGTKTARGALLHMCCKRKRK